MTMLKRYPFFNFREFAKNKLIVLFPNNKSEQFTIMTPRGNSSIVLCRISPYENIFENSVYYVPKPQVKRFN